MEGVPGLLTQIKYWNDRIYRKGYKIYTASRIQEDQTSYLGPGTGCPVLSFSSVIYSYSYSYYYYYLLPLSCHSVAVVLTLGHTKQIRINRHKRNYTKNTVQTIQNTINTRTHIGSEMLFVFSGFWFFKKLI